MSEVQLDAAAFHRRAKRLLDSWESADSPECKAVGSILVLQGRSDEKNPYTKTIATQMWLLGYEFPNTLMLFTKSKLYIVASQKKAKILQPLENVPSGIPLEILVHGKQEDKNQEMLAQLISAINDNGSAVGVIANNSTSGKLVDEWNAVYAPSKAGIAEHDISRFLSSILAVKEENEIKHEKVAATLCTTVMQDYFIDEMENIFDEEKSITNEKMAEKIANVLVNDKLAKRLFSKIPMLEMAEWSTQPSVQSGGRYDLSLNAESSSAQLHAGTVVCTLNMRYFMYNATIARTFMIGPTPEQEGNYNFLLKLHKHMLGWVRPGETMSSVYAKTIDYVKEHRPDLESHLSKDCGCVTGIEMSDSVNIINSKCNETLKANMTISLRIGLENLVNDKAADKQARNYSYQLIDTLVVKDNGDAEVITKCSKEPNDVSFFFNDEEPAQEQKRAPKRESGATEQRPTTRKSAILPSKFRSEEKEEESTTRKRREHQKELLNRLAVEGRRRFAGEEGGNDEETRVVKKFESYKRETAIPREARNCKILVDERADTIILPIYGMSVPFHISTLKSISKNDEGEYVYLRLNMVSPGQGVGKKDNLPVDDLGSTFVRLLTFRSTDVVRMNEIYHSIMALKRDQVKRDTEKEQLADIVEQDRLTPVHGQRPERLPDVFMRPVAEGKRFPAALEIHANGLRYLSAGRTGGTPVDILFNNIRHLFYQPCDYELLVLIHVHLKNPIMLGKKKIQDIQFYREASDASFDETGNRRRRIRYGDEDEIEAEQEERRRRRKLNKEFKEFASKIAEASNHEVEVDTPFREVAFSGVPARANVLLQPTVDCLVHLSDTPFFIITVADVEIVHLERVQFGLKNFDMVFVFKDFKRTPVHVNTVPMKQLDNVKEWLDSVNLAYTEGPVNYNWTQIMKTINKDPAGFYEDGGWSFLAQDSDAEDEESEEEESEFSVSEEEFEESESESSQESGFGTESGESEEEEEEDYESGEDWDELEAKAKAYDEKRTLATDAPSGRGPAKRARKM
ncbi:FACT complex subunit spt16 [Coemansia spiralis]|uniref:FACT complex subunit n=2 Tax=Coemansia TaxID=4863 RepID=A0A9W8KZ44_9FUNG|nr:FACT complex subunit SPT16 N-terminal lobe domain-containing protein [Coemansia spiralis]KAJ1991311.1 FACT complex subunit spt16 [Coemansia umbellata]KAJ2622192.1 FACT complex subunit spt16 [Coemansia sp. RSA 1358]KAJ2678401.1 FACT complex subunit spt16 [Coemansia spiralis]